MELTFRTAAPGERLYIARQSTQIEGQTGSIGHLQADMGEDGKGFFPKWTSHRENLDTEEFQQEFEEVLEALVGDEQYGGFLKSLSDPAAPLQGGGKPVYLLLPPRLAGAAHGTG